MLDVLYHIDYQNKDNNHRFLLMDLLVYHSILMIELNLKKIKFKDLVFFGEFLPKENIKRKNVRGKNRSTVE
jgi:hypothetical protein